MISSFRFFLKIIGIVFYRTKAPLHRLVHFFRYEWRRLSPYSLSYCGYRVWYEKGDGLANHLSNGYRFESGVIRCAVSLLHPGDIIFDVGANIGLISLAIHRKVPKTTIHCFEPSPYPFRMLKKTIRENALQRYLIPWNMGIYKKAGELTFHVHATKDALGDGIRDTHRAGETEPINIRVTSIDRFVAKHRIPALALIKVDVEGSELSVLQGAKQTLKKYHPAILFEANPKNVQAYNLRVSDIYRFLRSMDYSIYTLRKKLLSENEFTLMTGKEDNYLALPN